MKLYAVSPLAQKTEVDNYCFDECGKISVGGMNIENEPFFFCDEEKCEFEERTLKGYWETDGGDEVVIRKLMTGRPT